MHHSTILHDSCYSGINIIKQVASFETLNLQYMVNTAVYNPDGTYTIFSEVLDPTKDIENKNFTENNLFTGFNSAPCVIFDRNVVQESPVAEEPAQPPVVEEPQQPPAVEEHAQPPVNEEPTAPPVVEPSELPVELLNMDITKVMEKAGYDNTLLALNKANNNLQVIFASSDDTKNGQTVNKSFKTNDFSNLNFLLLPNAWNIDALQKALQMVIDGIKKLAFEDNKLYLESENGEREQLKTEIFHSNGISTDNFEHALVENDQDKIRISFEDLKGGGDKDFDDLVFDVKLNQASA